MEASQNVKTILDWTYLIHNIVLYMSVLICILIFHAYKKCRYNTLYFFLGYL